MRSLDMLRARLADCDVRAAIVDLDAPDVAIDLIRALRDPSGPAAGRSVRIVAFGPHIATELFEQARAAGADAVLARGAFDRRLPEILAELAGAADRPGGPTLRGG
ncbi:MAG: hypothetical protein WD749_13495 [Phycisphaerales bacterium]